MIICVICLQYQVNSFLTRILVARLTVDVRQFSHPLVLQLVASSGVHLECLSCVFGDLSN